MICIARNAIYWAECNLVWLILLIITKYQELNCNSLRALVLCSALFVVAAVARSRYKDATEAQEEISIAWGISQQKTLIFEWKMRWGKLHISWKTMVQHHFYLYILLLHCHMSILLAFRLMRRPPRRRSRCPGIGQWVNHWWFLFHSICIVHGSECRTAVLQNVQPPPVRSSLPDMEEKLNVRTERALL